MFAYVQRIRFYIDDIESNLEKQRFSDNEISIAYDIASSDYRVEKNRELSASISLLEKELLRLANTYVIKKDDTGTESTELQSLATLMNARKTVIASLENQINKNSAKENQGSAGFGIRSKRTIIKGIND